MINLPLPLYYKASFLYLGARAFLVGATTPEGSNQEIAVVTYDAQKARLFHSSTCAQRCEEKLQTMAPEQFVCV